MNPLLLALALSSTDANAKDMAPPMWGIGPTLSTLVFPFNHPISLPTVQDEALVDGVTDPYVNTEGVLNTMSDDQFHDVRGDAALGFRGVIYFNNEWRAGMRGNLGFGKDYSSGLFGLEVDKILFSDGRLNAFAGAGIGLGSMKFKSDDGNAYVKAPQYPIRGQVGGLYKLNKSAIELSFFLQIPISGRATLYIEPENGDSTEIETRNLNPISYMSGGLELAYYFGDFKQREGKKKGKGKRGR
jgi:hypothetical protein